MLYFLLLLAVSLAVMFSKIFPLAGRRESAPAVVSWSADLQSKFAYQRTNLISLVALLLLGTGFHLVPRIVSIFSVFAALLILTLPLRFSLGEEGISVNGKVLRYWTELKFHRLQQRRLVLKGKGRLSFLILYLPEDGKIRKYALQLIQKKMEN